jgi:hypothetical protein
VVILITSGWALLVIYLITILATVFPIDIRNLAWSQNLSRLIVDAGSLALVGLCLIRYGSYLRSLDLGEIGAGAPFLPHSGSLLQRSSSAASPLAGIAAPPAGQGFPSPDAPAGKERIPQEQGDPSSPGLSRQQPVPEGMGETQAFDPVLRPKGRRRSSQHGSARGSARTLVQPPRDLLPPDPTIQELQGLERNRWLVRRLALLGAIGMALLIPLQMVIFLRGVTNIDLQVTQATVQERTRFQQLETALQDAPAQQIRQGWFQFKQLNPLSEPSNLPSPAQQLDDLIGEATRARDTSLQNLQRQASNARFELGRDTLRVILAALVFAWAFWAFFRPA